MRRFGFLVVVASVVACSSSSDPDAIDGGADTAIVDGGSCCPISAAPNCTPQLGGSRDETGGCNSIFDPPLDGWQMKTDLQGCPYWEVPSTGTNHCGGDAAADVARDSD